MKNFLDYTKDVQNVKSGFVTPIWWILKYIQEEDNLYINQNFFEWKKIITESDIDDLKKLFDEKLENIKKIKKDVNDSDLNDIEKKFILNSLNWVWLKYIIFKSSVFLEAEKSGFILTDEQRKFYLRRVNKIQNMVYWPEISSIDSEKKSVLEELNSLYETNNYKLEEWEKNAYLEYLKTLWFTWVNNNINNNVKLRQIDWTNYDKLRDDLENSIIKLKELNPEDKNYQETKEEIKKINEELERRIFTFFKMLIYLYDLKWRNVFIDENVWNFSIKWKQIIIPKSKIKNTSLKRILELFDHEIWVHAIRWFNSSKTIKTNGDWYLEIEEWMATLTEFMFDKKIDDISVKPTIHHITTYVAENFDFDKTIKFLELYYKLLKPKNTSYDDIKKEVLDRAIRIKRFVSFKEKWANRKDVSYTRWQSQIVDFFQNSDTETRWQFIKDFYFAKLAFEDIWLVKEFRESLDIDESELKYPLWIGKILYKKLLWEKITLAWLKEEDFRFQIIEKLSIWVKRKIVKILQEVRWKKK